MVISSLSFVNRIVFFGYICDADGRGNNKTTLAVTEQSVNSAALATTQQKTKTVKYVKGKNDKEEVNIVDTVENYEVPDDMRRVAAVNKCESREPHDVGYIHSFFSKPAGTRDTGYVTLSRDVSAGSLKDISEETYLNETATRPKTGLKRAKTFKEAPRPPSQALKKTALRKSEVVYVNSDVNNAYPSLSRITRKQEPAGSPPPLPNKGNGKFIRRYRNFVNLETIW